MSYPLHCFRQIATFVLLVAGSALLAAAQTPTGSIRGTVTDEQEAIIQNAVITVSSKATGDVRNVNSGEDGHYLVANLLPGEYELKIDLACE